MENKFAITKKAGIFGVLGNLFLFLIKSIIGVLFKSQSMIADSVNSACDIFASIMTLIGGHIASVPFDDNHNFGHGKAEYIFSMFISISMILLSIKLLLDSFKSFIFGNTITFSWLLVIACIITIIIKFILFLYTLYAYKKFHSILVESNMKDHRNDCIITSFTLISILFSFKGINWIDSMVGFGISAWICYTGIKIFVESFNVLMDISIDEKTKDLIFDIALSFKDIKNVENISSSPVGDCYLVFITIDVDGNLSTFESHKLADFLELSINKLDNVYKTVVHVNPV